MSSIAAKIDQFIDLAYKSKDEYEYEMWSIRVKEFLQRAVSLEIATEFHALWSGGNRWERSRDRQIGMLEGLAAHKVESAEALRLNEVRGNLQGGVAPRELSKRVFVVHGHDSGAKDSVARYVEKLGLEATILHEQPNSGRAVIEKFEDYSDVGFAIVLLTPDDIGGLVDRPDQLNPRARQNVIFELGYFVGRLSRSCVCALYKKGVEIPSDLSGVLFVEFDPGGAWRKDVARELVEAGLQVDRDALFRS
jgi:predicted nucleotide-binding protein